MQEKYTKTAKQAIEYAKIISKKLGHSYVGSEHLLIGLTSVPESVSAIVLKNYKVTEEKLIELIEQYIALKGGVEILDQVGFTPKAEKILERSAAVAAEFKSAQIGTEHILAAILRDTESAAPRLLFTLGINLQRMYTDLLLAMGEDPNKVKEHFSNGRPVTDKNKNSLSTLKQYSRDLIEAEKDGKIDPVIGRNEEIERVLQILSRKTKVKPEPIIDEFEDDQEEIKRLAENLFKDNEFSVYKINEFVLSQLGSDNQIHAKDIKLKEFNDLLKVFLVKLYSANANVEYSVKYFDDEYKTLGYKMKDFIIERKV